MLELQIKGIERIKRDLREMSKELGEKVIDAATRGAAKRFATEAKARCTSKQARDSIKVIRFKDATKGQYTYIVHAGFRTPFAHIIEFGAQPHRILPNQKKRKAINYIAKNSTKIKRATVAEGKRSVLRIDGQYTPYINHPGVSAKPYMRPAFDQYGDEALKDFVKAAERAMIRMARQGKLTGSYWGNV